MHNSAVSHKRSIDIFRGILVILVTNYHFFLIFSATTLGSTALQASLLAHGALGVAGFFVLSGYLLTKKWVTQDSSVLSILSERSIRLLLPFVAAYLVLYVVYAVGAGQYANLSASLGYSWGLIQPIGMLSSLDMQTVYHSIENQLAGKQDYLILSAWTMHHELKAILLAAAIITLVRLFSTRLKAWQTVLLHISLWVGLLCLYRDGYGLLDAFALGSVFAVMLNLLDGQKLKRWLTNNLRAALISLGVMIFVLYLFVFMLQAIGLKDLLAIGLKGKDSFVFMTLLYLLTDAKYLVFGLFTLCFAPLLLLVVTKSSVLTKVLGHLSKLSFSIYLVHQQVIMLMLLGLSFLPIHINWGIVMFVFWVAVYLVAEIFHSVIEQPSYRLAKLTERFLQNKSESKASLVGAN